MEQPQNQLSIEAPSRGWLVHYSVWRELPDGRIIGAHRLLYHWTMHVGITEWGYDERYCYDTAVDVAIDVLRWDGQGDPPGRWHKHPDTGRRRDPETGEIWNERDDYKRLHGFVR